MLWVIRWQEKYVSLLEFRGFLNGFVVECDLIFIRVGGIDKYNVSKIKPQKKLIFHVFIEINKKKNSECLWKKYVNP